MEKEARASKKQRELLAFIDAFIKGNNYGPSYREIMRALGYKSVSTVAVHVDGLIAKGYLRKRDNSARSIEVVRRDAPSSTVDAHHSWLRAEVKKKLGDETVNDTQKQQLLDTLSVLGVAHPDND